MEGYFKTAEKKLFDAFINCSKRYRMNKRLEFPFENRFKVADWCVHSSGLSLISHSFFQSRFLPKMWYKSAFDSFFFGESTLICKFLNAFNSSCFGHHRIILLVLMPLRLLFGISPSDALLTKYDLSRFKDLVRYPSSGSL